MLITACFALFSNLLIGKILHSSGHSHSHGGHGKSCNHQHEKHVHSHS